MMKLLDNIRTPNRKISVPKALFHTVLITGMGVVLGGVAKLLDIYASNLGHIFSQMSVWIFICTVISVLSNTPLRAVVNVFSFCVGMLPAYYLTAELTSRTYSMLFVYGWTVFALLTPVFAFCTWYAKGKKLISKIIGVGIIFIMFVLAVVVFDKIRIADIIFAVFTGIFCLPNRRLNL